MKLRGKRAAILVDDFYQPLEYWYPYSRLREEGAEVKQVSNGEFHTTRHGYKSAKRDLFPAEAKAAAFDAVVIPGGFAPDKMREDEEMLRFVREMDDAGKVVAAICHGPWVPISAGITAARRMTAYPSIRADVINARAEFIDRDVVCDRNLVTSRTPDDLPAFCRAIIEAIATL